MCHWSEHLYTCLPKQCDLPVQASFSTLTRLVLAAPLRMRGCVRLLDLMMAEVHPLELAA